jgi:hypothetical protein
MADSLSVGNKSYHALGPIFKKRSISQSVKIRLYETVIRPIVIYGAEAWTLTNKMERMLMTWERKILRKIYMAQHMRIDTGEFKLILN